MTRHADLFAPRQLTALVTFGDLVRAARERLYVDAVAAGLEPGEAAGDRLEAGGTGAAAYAEAVAVYLAFAVDRQADYSSALCGWVAKGEFIRSTYSMQSLSMTWDYAESAPLNDSTGGFPGAVAWVALAIERLPTGKPGSVSQLDAPLAITEGVVVSTDPPYYDNVGYADLSDFFYVWLRVSLPRTFPTLLGTVLTPKASELVADPFRHGGNLQAQRFFEDGFTGFFAKARGKASTEFPMTVFYAFKQSESDDTGTASTGWQTLLEGMLTAGWEVTATWPVRTERGGRSRDIGSNALASSIVLACRPRPTKAEALNRRQFISSLKSELPAALRYLQQGAVAPVDLAQAAIGPGMAVFSRYARVVEADGSDMKVRTALALINQVLDEVLTEQEGDFDADTRFCVKWFSQYGWNEAASGEADVLARATNTSVDGLMRGGVFRAVAGKARLIAPDELAEKWDPVHDDRVSDWEVVVRLAQSLKTEGVDGTAPLVAAAGQRVDLDTAQELAYLLFSICEKKGWTESALLFNALGSAWSDLTTAARSLPTASDAQGTLTWDEE